MIDKVMHLDMSILDQYALNQSAGTPGNAGDDQIAGKPHGGSSSQALHSQRSMRSTRSLMARQILQNFEKLNQHKKRRNTMVPKLSMTRAIRI